MDVSTILPVLAEIKSVADAALSLTDPSLEAIVGPLGKIALTALTTWTASAGIDITDEQIAALKLDFVLSAPDAPKPPGA